MDKINNNILNVSTSHVFLSFRDHIIDESNYRVKKYDEPVRRLSKLFSYSDSCAIPYSEIQDVALWFLSKESMSHKKLQKLCYYAYAWFLVFFNDHECASKGLNTMCPTGFQAWVHGPVCPDLYTEYRDYGWRDIPSPTNTPSFSSDMTELLEQVWKVYGKFSADQLEYMTHKESPWIEARKDLDVDEPSCKKIDDMSIFKFFSHIMERG